ncbi:CaiB/BaiF CoA transferase family protein [Marinivivus vitaminiproducens]|uniref:CaiB/BaiF CoA transferase family protein n=1 Tax=Marinivivus vitaminiproducens TaxID=3035935 RepID=UPI0027A2DA0D|nr:CoA transferase [Geminicoccaceae bacterium SCSIO 64248]
MSAPELELKPLAGLRVVDFSWVVAGPMTTKMLALMGAEVIKIESTTRPEHKNRTAGFHLLNNNKRSCTIDIRTTAGQDVLHRLVAKSDIVVENFSARVLQKYRLGYEDLRKVRPDLIFVSASGVGRSGPQRDALAYGTMLQAYSGRAGLIGQPNAMVEAMGILPIWTDPVTAMWETFSVLAAIHHRNRTGHGSYLDLSMLEGTVSLLPEALLRLSLGGDGTTPGGLSDGESAPGGCFRCAGTDDWIAIAVGTDAEWQALCDAMAAPDLAVEHPNAASRRAALSELNAKIATWCGTQDAVTLEARLRSLGVPAARTRHFGEVIDDPDIRRRGLFVDLPDGRHTTALPWREADTGFRGDLAPTPELGADNDHVFQRILGLSDDEVAALRGQEVAT